MKPIVKKIWISIAVLCTFLNASAYDYDFESDGLCYNILSEEDRTVEVTGYQKYSGDIEIPEKVICKSKTYTVTSIGDYALRECSSLTSVTIPNSVTYIGDYAFSECSSLTSMTIPNSVTYIGDFAFSGCSSLTSVTIPNSVTAIGKAAFYYCSRLTSVTIPNSVTSIGVFAFRECGSLTSVTIPNSVTSIGICAFSECRSLESINVDPGNVNYSTIYGILYNKDATSLICCPGAKVTVTIPNSVTAIGEYAFYWCSSLTSVTIPNSVTSIGEHAFSSCRSLTSVTIPNSVTAIGEYAFSWCISLTSVTIPNSVTSIGDYAFEKCESLKSIYMLCEVPIECSPSFEESSLKEAVLYVPTGTKTEYEKVDPWRNFWNIVETDFNFSGINGIETDEYGAPHISVNNGILTIDGIDSHESVTVYDMQGRTFYNGTSHTIDDLSSGLYIVKAGSRTIKISI